MVNLGWAKPDGRTGQLHLPRGNAGYWALKDKCDALILKVQEVQKEVEVVPSSTQRMRMRTNDRAGPRSRVAYGWCSCVPCWYR